MCKHHIPATWEETFMEMAEVMSRRSKDQVTQVGAIIVSDDNRILSAGYNGAPNGYDDKIFPWRKDSDNPLENKHLFVIHAERNAILNYRGNMRDLQNATCYVTHYPCIECSKELVQAGIKNIIYLHNKGDELTKQATKQIFDNCGITIKQYAQ